MFRQLHQGEIVKRLFLTTCPAKPCRHKPNSRSRGVEVIWARDTAESGPLMILICFGENADLLVMPGDHNYSQRRCARVELTEYNVHPGVTSYFTSVLDIMYCKRN